MLDSGGWRAGAWRAAAHARAQVQVPRARAAARHTARQL